VENPQDPKTPRPSDPNEPDDAGKWVSPRLRAKMNGDDDEDETPKSHNLLATVMLLAVVAMIGALVVMMGNTKRQEKIKAVAAAKAAAVQARADSIDKAVQDSVQKVRADSVAAAEAKKPKKKTPPAATPGAKTTTQAETPAAPAAHFGIDVGTFLNEERAKAEQSKLQGSSGLTGQVLPVTQDGVTSYRVVMGDFTSRADADKKAVGLIGSGARQAIVTKLKGAKP
jgi:cell division septation protein DedD